MIFCPTRRASVTTAKMLADMWTGSHPSQRLWRGPDKHLSFSNTDVNGTPVSLFSLMYFILTYTQKQPLLLGLLCITEGLVPKIVVESNRLFCMGKSISYAALQHWQWV